MSDFTNKKIVLGVTGGIAAYKSIEVLRLLSKQGARVQVVMTRSATEFVSPLTFQALSGRSVRSELFDRDAEAGMGHIELARWADLIVIAPASANTLAKISHGMADDLLSTLCLATAAPLLLAPAMNQHMWHQSVTQNNIAQLRRHYPASVVCGPAQGEQACGDSGLGRMEEAQIIVQSCARLLRENGADTGLLTGKRVVITAGPTIEDIDPVRYLSNRSSGKMGYAIATAARNAGAEVVLVSGPVALEPPDKVELHPVRNALQMHDTVMRLVKGADVFIATAAVADYRPKETKANKIKKTQASLTLEFIKNPDILAEVAALADRPLTIGFAAETHDLESYAIAKLQAKNLDMIAANKVGTDEGFEQDYNQLQLFFSQRWNKENTPKSAHASNSKNLAYASKKQLAGQLVEEVALLLNRMKEDME